MYVFNLCFEQNQRERMKNGILKVHNSPYTAFFSAEKKKYNLCFKTLLVNLCF